jgi:hypothetical protein
MTRSTLSAADMQGCAPISGVSGHFWPEVPEISKTRMEPRSPLTRSAMNCATASRKARCCRGVSLSQSRQNDARRHRAASCARPAPLGNPRRPQSE